MNECPLCNGAGRVQLFTEKTDNVKFIDCPQCKPHVVASNAVPPVPTQVLPRGQSVILEEILKELKSINTGIWQIENNTDG